MKIGDTNAHVGDRQFRGSKEAEVDGTGSFAQQLKQQVEHLDRASGPAPTPAGEASNRSVDFANITRSELFDWMNEQAEAGKLSNQDSMSLVALTLKFQPDGELDKGPSMERLNLIEMAQQGIKGALWRNDLDYVERLESILQIMTSDQSASAANSGSGLEERALRYT